MQVWENRNQVYKFAMRKNVGYLELPTTKISGNFVVNSLGRASIEWEDGSTWSRESAFNGSWMNIEGGKVGEDLARPLIRIRRYSLLRIV